MPREVFSSEHLMPQNLGYIALVVRDYDEAIAFFTTKLGFELVEDTASKDRLGRDKRWALIAPHGSRGTQILLAKASTPEEESRIGNQTGGRVFLFLHTDDFWRDYRAMIERGVRFVREPKDEPYGTVGVFEDCMATGGICCSRKHWSSDHKLRTNR